MNEACRNLILASEIAGFLHDLGKLLAEFAEEGMQGGVNRADKVKAAGFGAAHGAILEDERRAYPEPGSHLWLQHLKAHPGWREVLQIPDAWIEAGSCQAQGLGEPLRQHHANKHFPADELSLLGDLYMLGADVRDSALDKGSGKTRSSKQRLGYGFIADSFGQESKPYGPELLRDVWADVAAMLPAMLFDESAQPWWQPAKARARLFVGLAPLFSAALGETRRPTNDVTLWHHCFSTASLFKSAVAEGVLKQDFSAWQDRDGFFDFKLQGRVRYRLLGIRWDWSKLTQGALKPVVYSALAQQKQEAIQALRELLEVAQPVGNCIYQDDNGAVFVVPGFYQGESETAQAASDHLFRDHILDALQDAILNSLVPLGAGTPVRVAWTRPNLYLSDYHQVLAVDAQYDHERWLQIGLTELQADWANKAGQAHICPQCGLRPGLARELEVYQSGLDDDDQNPQGWCLHCEALASDLQREKRRRHAEQLFGFAPETFNLQRIREQRNHADNARVVLLSVQINAKAIASGEALMTELARPYRDITLPEGKKSEPLPQDIQAAGDYLEDIWQWLLTQPDDAELEQQLNPKRGLIENLMGDGYWLKTSDGRMPDYDSVAKQGAALAEQFFLHEALPEGLGLYRHTGDRLLLFGIRKHASPARLARLWDDFRELWLDIMRKVAECTDHYAMPLSLDAHGFRLIVSAQDARHVIATIKTCLDERLQKVRGGIAPQLSALVFRDKFPLYVAMDALRRMERRPRRRQTWTVLSQEVAQQTVSLSWSTPHGNVDWVVNCSTGDSNQDDIWHPHVIVTSVDAGPQRLVLLKDLRPGMQVNLPVADFDFVVLDGTVRRYEIAYDEQGCRPHFILGQSGRSAYLWEHLPVVLDELPALIAGWSPSQSKGLIGQIIECYEKWVRDAPASLQDSGREAWHLHVRALLTRVTPPLSSPETELIMSSLDDGLFFDAFEWAGFVEKAQKRMI